MTATRIAAPRVAYQGEPGAYGEMAITREWNGQATAVGTATFADAFGLLGKGETDYAVMPVWNSTIGDIPEPSLLMSHHASRVEIVAEVTVPVVHCLIGLPGATLATVHHVGSHPTALAQCRRLFTNGRGLQPCIARDTAGAARELAALGGRISHEPSRPASSPPWFEPYRTAESNTLAVIAGAPVARIYGLIVIAEGVQDNPANATRFVVVKAQDGVRW